MSAPSEVDSSVPVEGSPASAPIPAAAEGSNGNAGAVIEAEVSRSNLLSSTPMLTSFVGISTVTGMTPIQQFP